MDDLEIRSSRGSYRVRFAAREERLTLGEREHAIVDARLAMLRPGDAHVLGGVAIPVDAGEGLKTLGSVEGLCARLLERGVRRGDRLVAVGGATVLDVVGFVAGTLLRGLSWRSVPTTLLAQADACVGGKTGLNVGRYKNVLGTITPPDEVTVDVSWLSTLDDVAWRSGLAEMLKAQAIEGPVQFDELADNLTRLRHEAPALAQAVHAALRTKKTLVELDEFDDGQRRLLNYGHTFGHAIEAATDHQLAHGIAVALGMRIANALSARLGLLDVARAGRMELVLEPLCRDAGPVDVDLVMSALDVDKKRVGDGHRFILLGPGAAAAEVRVAQGDARVREAVVTVLTSMLPSAPALAVAHTRR